MSTRPLLESGGSRGDSNPPPPRYERRRKFIRRVLQPLTSFEYPSNGQDGQPKLCWTRHSYRELSSWILRFPIGKNRLKADVLLIASHFFQQPMRFNWLAWKSGANGDSPIPNEALGPHWLLEEMGSYQQHICF